MAEREPFVVCLVLAVHRLVRHSYHAVKGAIDGLWLAVLRPATLAAVGDAFYRTQRQFVDDGYNESGLWVWERDAVERFTSPGSRIVVTGAGGGREVLALAELGYDVVGYECDRAMVAFSGKLLARHGHDTLVHACDPDVWPAPGGRFDAVVVGWGSYTHIRTRARRVEFLRGARAGLEAGGTVILSFFDRTPSMLVYLRIARLVGGALRRIVPGPPVELGDGLMPNYGHNFSRREIVEELDAAGFDLVDFQIESYARAIGQARAGG